MIVIRHATAGVPHMLAERTCAAVINAGDGSHEHPTQALLDAYTMREHRAARRAATVTIVGDIEHSRVARSNIWGLRAAGRRRHASAGRARMMPRRVEDLGVPRCPIRSRAGAARRRRDQ